MACKWLFVVIIATTEKLIMSTATSTDNLAAGVEKFRKFSKKNFESFQKFIQLL